MKTEWKTVAVEHRFGEVELEWSGDGALEPDELRAAATPLELQQLLHLTECSQATEDQRRAAVAALALDYQITPVETEVLLELELGEIVSFILDSGRPLSDETLPVPEGLPVHGLLDPRHKGARAVLERHRAECEGWALARRWAGMSVWPGPKLAEEDGEQ